MSILEKLNADKTAAEAEVATAQKKLDSIVEKIASVPESWMQKELSELKAWVESL